MSYSVYEEGLRGLAEGHGFALLISVSSNPLLSGSLKFFDYFANFAISKFGEKNCIVHSLFCIFIIITIIIISSSSTISFVAFLNCNYLNARVSPFVHFSSSLCWGGGLSEWLPGPNCPLPG